MATDYRKKWADQHPRRVSLSEKLGRHLDELAEAAGVSSRQLSEETLWRHSADVAGAIVQGRIERVQKVAGDG